MVKRSGSIVLVALVSGLVSGRAALADLHASPHRPSLVEVGEPTMVDRSALRKEMERISDLKIHIARHGWPDYAEVQPVVAEDPFADYEVRVYYLSRQYEVDFANVDAAPWLKDFGIKRYEGPIPTETLGRLLTARPLSSPPVLIEPESPPPPSAAAPAAAVVEPPAVAAVPAEAAAAAPAAAADASGQAMPVAEEPAPPAP